MELKGYQNSVLDDLDEYLGALDRTGGIHAAWKDYWGHKGVAVNSGESQGVPGYFDDLAGVPNVCIKVPTGGGKTFLAACAVKHLFNRLPVGKTKLVAWLVPSDAILTQTVAHLSDPSHPYRQRLDRDFGGRVNVYTKEQLLNGQNFKPGDVAENLSVCVFCYASVRTSQIKKDDRKIYQENGNLLAFAETFKEKDALLAGTPETALLQVIRTMNPVVVVDESHNATSALSLEMLRNLNPSFVLAMTATPTERANVLSYVNARELKRENMVKLPVIVYNRPDRASVIRDAVRLRELLEAKAKEERKAGGSYIRPITLFQAQPRTSDDSETFDKIKAKLVGAGIPEKQIAIKTAQKDELGDTAPRELYLELMGRHSNLTLVKDGRIVDAIREPHRQASQHVLRAVVQRGLPGHDPQRRGRTQRSRFQRKRLSRRDSRGRTASATRAAFAADGRRGRERGERRARGIRFDRKRVRNRRRPFGHSRLACPDQCRRRRGCRNRRLRNDAAWGACRIRDGTGSRLRRSDGADGRRGRS